ncbi:MAG: WecB/TagA/CpsF family glycosyltransferase [Patescibacteria group bacterium]
MGIKIHKYSYPQVLRYIQQYLHGPKQHYIVTVNPEIVLAAGSDPDFKQILNQASLCVADGSGLQWAAVYNQIPLNKIPIIKQLSAFFQLFYSSIIFAFWPGYGTRVIPERITGVDLVPEIAKICARSQKSLFLLGAGPGVAAETARRLKHLYPNLNIVKSYSGSVGAWQPANGKKLVALINQYQPNCLLVAFGAPKQEKWISRHLHQISSVKLAVGVGGAFDFIAGQKSILGGGKAIRAPRWIQKIRLEWLHRLLFQPSRLRRIYQAVIVFPWRVMIQKINNQG